MKNSKNTIKLFNEVMDFFDSLSDEEFNERIKQSENGELTNLFLSAGFFNKEELDFEETLKGNAEWKDQNLNIGIEREFNISDDLLISWLADINSFFSKNKNKPGLIGVNGKATYNDRCPECQKAA